MSEVEKVEHRIIIKENWLFCVLSKEGRAQNTYKREMLPCLWGAVPFHKYSVFYFLYLEHRKTKLFVTKIETVFFYNLFVVYLLRRFEKIITKYFFCYLDVYSLKIFDLSFTGCRFWDVANVLYQMTIFVHSFNMIVRDNNS